MVGPPRGDPKEGSPQGGLNGKWSGPLPGGVVVDPRLAPLTISGKWVGMGQ